MAAIAAIVDIPHCLTGMRPTRKGLVLAAPAAMLALLLALPAPVSAVVGWSLSAFPTTLDRDEEQNVFMHLADTLPLGDIGCLHLDVPRTWTFAKPG